MLVLQAQSVEDYITHMETRRLQQEAILGHLMCHVVRLSQSGATRSLELPLTCSSLGPMGDAGGGQQAQSSRLPDQLSHQLSDLEAAFVSYDLSNHEFDISALFHSSFQDYTTYQGDKYHEDKNTSGSINLGIRRTSSALIGRLRG